MSVRLAIRTLSTLLVIAASGLLGHQECRADMMSLTDLFGANDNAMITSGFFTYSFNKESVLNTTFPQGRGPTLDTVFVSTVPSGLTFAFIPPLSLAGSTQQNFNVTLFYTVTSTEPIIGAGLSFSARVPSSADNFTNPEANASVNETVTNDLTLKVFKTNDQQGNQTARNDQSAGVPATMFLSITDTVNVSIPVRGDGGSGQVPIDSLTNLFIVPEPSNFALTSIAGLVGLGAAWRGRRRSAA
jgi:hypothetical protein